MKLICRRIENLLIKYPHLRDSDERLIANIWFQDLTILRSNKVDALQAYAEGKLTKAESIRRSRQKIQQHNIGLRGSNYKGRHAAQPDLVDQLHEEGSRYAD